MKVLVTGGAGFIGSHVVEAFLARGEEVVCFDNFNDYYNPARKRKNVAPFLESPRYRLYEQDVRDLEGMERVFAQERVEKIVHLAAQVGVRHSVEHPLDYPSTNERGTLYLLDLGRRYGVRNFIFASSSSVYGAYKGIPFRETDPTDRPLAPYAASKKAAEVLTYAYHHSYGLPCTCLRLFSVYGPRGRPDMAPYLFTQRILEEREITLFDEGRPKRDWTYIDDIVQGVLAALDADFDYEIINLGRGEPVAMRDFVDLIERATGREARIVSSSLPPSELPVTHADISKACRLLDYNPRTSLEEGLPRFVDWFRREVEDA